jgi:hypothetical protein
MSIYPDLPGARRSALARDALLLVLLASFVWLGIRVHHDLGQLSGVGRGVTAAGDAVRSGFLSAASAAAGIPIAGGAIADALRAAGRATGGHIVNLGQTSAATADQLATIVGLVVWGVPTLLLVGLAVPSRIREIRRLRALRRALRAPNREQRLRLIALRAVLTVPDEVLFAYTADPAGDLLSGRYEPLAEAALEAAGVSADRLGL